LNGVRLTACFFKPWIFVILTFEEDTDKIKIKGK